MAPGVPLAFSVSYDMTTKGDFRVHLGGAAYSGLRRGQAKLHRQAGRGRFSSFD
jgi:hypothetical protein